MQKQMCRMYVRLGESEWALVVEEMVARQSFEKRENGCGTERDTSSAIMKFSGCR